MNDIYEDAILPAYRLLPSKMASPQATAMLLAIGLQESRLHYRRQIRGPARGLWQFEKGGGVAGVLRHEASREHALRVTRQRTITAGRTEVYHALEFDDILAAAFARLLLWTDPAPLPALGDVHSSWAYYLRNWRPGKPHPATWPAFYERAVSFALRQ